MDFCSGSESTKSADKFRAFILDYIDSSWVQRVCLGPEEYKWTRTVNSVTSVLDLWKGLVAHANKHVLQEKRNSDPENRGKWRLTLNDTNERGNGPVFQISNVRHAAFHRYFIKADVAPSGSEMNCQSSGR